jgi:hypothetical protein
MVNTTSHCANAHLCSPGKRLVFGFFSTNVMLSAAKNLVFLGNARGFLHYVQDDKETILVTNSRKEKESIDI